MKRATFLLVIAASIVYYAVLFFGQSFLPSNFSAPAFFLAAPLLVLVLILLGDMSSRATVPVEVQAPSMPSRKLSRDVQELARQIEVGTDSSPAYFQQVVLARLREALIGKVAVETGMEVERVREVLANPHLGPGLLRDGRLYGLLYSAPSGKGPARVRLLEDMVALVESWKP